MMHVEEARVLRQEKLTEAHRVLVLECPHIAGEARAGQFVHFQVPSDGTLTLRRPFSIYGLEATTISLLYKIVGKGTRAMAALDTGDIVSLIGPLGNGFPEISAGAFPVLVAGGYGVAPLRLLATKSATRGIVMIGAKTARDVLCKDELETLGWQVRVATEDGTEGRKGLVTGILSDWRAGEAAGLSPELYACGPDGMLKAICDMAASARLKAWVSVERHMGCGVGACLACVVRIKDNAGKTKRARVCKDGPVFESGQVVWE